MGVFLMLFQQAVSQPVILRCAPVGAPRRMHGHALAAIGPSPFEALASLGHLRVTGQQQAQPANAYPPFACLIVRHTTSGVAGISMCLTPRCESASTIAFATAGMAPTQPASPAPLTPSGLVAVGTGLLLTSNALKLSARGMA